MAFIKLNIVRLILIAFLLLGEFSQTTQAGESVVIGISPSLTATLSIIAKEQGYFNEQGVDVQLRVIESGSKAVAMMMNGQIDISESSVFGLVSNSFIRKDFSIFTQLSISGNDNMIVARRDRGIKTISDLKGKKVGVLKVGFPHYVLDLMLLNAGIDSGKIQLVYGEPDQLCKMLVSGVLDAVCVYGGWIDKAEKSLKENAVEFYDGKLVRVTVVQACKSRLVERNPDFIKKILNAYIKAEAYVKNNPDKAERTVVEYLHLDMNNSKRFWKPNMMHVALEQSLIKDMENMARWQIDTGMTNNTKVPNYLSFINFKSLTEVDPARVTITH